ncbi:hypothetical protein LNTAR_12641 [Lentisphaera araneosa HTCC2155]|uniref:Uncharacterized protein n=1 Tax=Lentisphaera araneosa HTCC2155 TaxID=313628 RepID=A6DJX9_9BACT|nr:hypothetical protein LNTAR_12641 [Lentisphaera araneosa HTCC2155]
MRLRAKDHLISSYTLPSYFK